MCLNRETSKNNDSMYSLHRDIYTPKHKNGEMNIHRLVKGKLYANGLFLYATFCPFIHEMNISAPKCAFHNFLTLIFRVSYSFHDNTNYPE